jgi:hypothetical protein
MTDPRQRAQSRVVETDNNESHVVEFPLFFRMLDDYADFYDDLAGLGSFVGDFLPSINAERTMEAAAREFREKKDHLKQIYSTAGAAFDLREADKVLHDIGLFRARDYVFYVKPGKHRPLIIFKGYAGLRRLARGTRYRFDHPVVARLGIRPKGIGSNIRAGGITFFVYGAIDVIDWILKDDATLGELAASLTIDLGLAAIGTAATMAATALTAAAASAIVGAAVVGAGPIIVGVAVGLIVSTAVGYAVDNLGVKEKLTKAFDKAFEFIEESYEEFRLSIRITAAAAEIVTAIAFERGKRILLEPESREEKIRKGGENIAEQMLQIFEEYNWRVPDLNGFRMRDFQRQLPQLPNFNTPPVFRLR